MARKREFGGVRVSGNKSGKRNRATTWQAYYTGPDGRRHVGWTTFHTKDAARRWLDAERAYWEALADLRDWKPPKARAAEALAAAQAERGLTVEAYTDAWLAERAKARNLSPGTVHNYRRYLDQYVVPKLGDKPLRDVTTSDLTAWLADMGTGSQWERQHAYEMLRAVFNTAHRAKLIPESPCLGVDPVKARSGREIKAATLDQLAAMVAALPEELRLMCLLMAWCALRVGEVAELRRRDVDHEEDDQGEWTKASLYVARQVQRVGGETIVKEPKAHSVGRVPIPPALLPVVSDHLDRFAQPGPDGLLFPNRHGVQHNEANLWRRFAPAREAAGLSRFRLHDLRHTAATLAAGTGATLKDVMAWGRWKDAKIALGYQKAAENASETIAARLSSFVARDTGG
jgi:integrase